jgi:MSHA pilin protein MshA
MKRSVRGFTLIEQIAAIALAGAASAVAVPALVDLQADAEAATLRSLAQAATSAMVLNQAGCQVTDQALVPGKCTPVRHCGDVAELLLAGLPPGYQVPEVPLRAVGVGAACRLIRDSNGAEAAFIGIAAGT